MVKTDLVLPNYLNSLEVDSTIYKNALKKAINEVSDTKLKKKFQNRSKNAESP